MEYFGKYLENFWKKFCRICFLQFLSTNNCVRFNIDDITANRNKVSYPSVISFFEALLDYLVKRNVLDGQR